MSYRLSLLGIAPVLLAVLLLWSAQPPLQPAVRAGSMSADVPRRSEHELQAAVASAPLLFIENVGQFAPEARFQVRGAHGALWLAQDALWISVLQPASDRASLDPLDCLPPTAEQQELTPRHGAHLRLSFLGPTRSRSWSRLTPWRPPSAISSAATQRAGGPMCPYGAGCAIATSTPALTWS